MREHARTMTLAGTCDGARSSVSAQSQTRGLKCGPTHPHCRGNVVVDLDVGGGGLRDKHPSVLGTRTNERLARAHHAHEVDEVGARLGRAHARHHLLALRTVAEEELCERVACVGLSRLARTR